MGRNIDGRIEAQLTLLQCVEQHVEGHHLSQRRWVPLSVRITGVKDVAGAAIQHHLGVLGRVRWAGAKDSDCRTPPCGSADVSRGVRASMALRGSVVMAAGEGRLHDERGKGKW